MLGVIPIDQAQEIRADTHRHRRARETSFYISDKSIRREVFERLEERVAGRLRADVVHVDGLGGGGVELAQHERLHRREHAARPALALQQAAPEAAAVAAFSAACASSLALATAATASSTAAFALSTTALAAPMQGPNT